jgi:hypothetical protein
MVQVARDVGNQIRDFDRFFGLVSKCDSGSASRYDPIAINRFHA